MALVGSHADDRVGSATRPALAGIGLRAGVAVAAGRAVRLRRVRAHAGQRVARAHIVALVGRRADDGVPADAGAARARIGPGAGVAVRARRAVRLRLRLAEVGALVAHAEVALIARAR